jgi:hypothetical protein
MEITVQVSSRAARALRGQALAIPESREIAQALEDLGVALEPMYPSAEDLESARYFTVEVPDLATGERVVSQLQRCAAVKVAFLKPPGEPPDELPGF